MPRCRVISSLGPGPFLPAGRPLAGYPSPREPRAGGPRMECGLPRLEAFPLTRRTLPASAEHPAPRREEALTRDGTCEFPLRSHHPFSSLKLKPTPHGAPQQRVPELRRGPGAGAWPNPSLSGAGSSPPAPEVPKEHWADTTSPWLPGRPSAGLAVSFQRTFHAAARAPGAAVTRAGAGSPAGTSAPLGTRSGLSPGSEGLS